MHIDTIFEIMSNPPDLLFQSNIDQLTDIVAHVFKIESFTRGDPKHKYLARYQGSLISEDSTASYDRLTRELRPLDITPLFRIENGMQTILLTPGVVYPKPSKIWVNLIFFILTVFSTFLVGAAYVYNGPPITSLSGLYMVSLANIWQGWPFAVSLLSILLAHEFGHYLASRYHHTAATLPYFIPMPVPGTFGTMGAVIFQKESHKNKRILLDIGMAGPLAGLIVAIPVLIIGLSLSQVDRLPTFLHANEGLSLEGNSILYLLLKYAVFHQWLPTPANFGNLPPLLYWVIYFFTGLPTPLGGKDVMLHPVAMAAWAGLLVTALNLIPVGQLDGGHILHGLFGERAASIRPIILTVLILLGLAWPGWWLWAILIFFLGRSYAEPLDQITPLDTKRKILALVNMVIFILVFTPVPLRAIGG